MSYEGVWGVLKLNKKVAQKYSQFTLLSFTIHSAKVLPHNTRHKFTFRILVGVKWVWLH